MVPPFVETFGVAEYWSIGVRVKIVIRYLFIENQKCPPDPPSNLAVIASDRRERGNLLYCGHLGDCFGRYTPSQ